MPHEKPSKPQEPEPSDQPTRVKHKTVMWQGPGTEGQQVWYNALNGRYTSAVGYGLIEEGWVFVMHVPRERAVIREVKA